MGNRKPLFYVVAVALCLSTSAIAITPIRTIMVQLWASTTNPVPSDRRGVWLDSTTVPNLRYYDGTNNSKVAAAAVTAKGDLVPFNGTNFARLAAGSNGQCLTAQSGQATGLQWATCGGGGSDLQSSYSAGSAGAQVITENSTNLGIELDGYSGQTAPILDIESFVGYPDGGYCTFYPSGEIDIGHGSIGTATDSSANGIFLSNDTAATSGNQQYSPKISLTGYGYKTDSGAPLSRLVGFEAQVRPAQGTANPTGNLVISSIINSTYTDIASLSNVGVFSSQGIQRLTNGEFDIGTTSTSTSGQLGGGASTGYFTWDTSTATIKSPGAVTSIAAFSNGSARILGSTSEELLINLDPQPLSDEAANTIGKVNIRWINAFLSNLQLGTLTAKGACDSSNRGRTTIEWGASGTRDKVYTCLKSDANAYNWILITDGGA